MIHFRQFGRSLTGANVRTTREHAGRRVAAPIKKVNMRIAIAAVVAIALYVCASAIRSRRALVSGMTKPVFLR